MHWTKEIITGLINDVDAGDFFTGLAFFTMIVLVFCGFGMGMYYAQVNNVRTEYREVMETQCGSDVDSDVCRYAATAYFEIKDKDGLVSSPLFWIMIVLLIEALLVAVFW